MTATSLSRSDYVVLQSDALADLVTKTGARPGEVGRSVAIDIAVLAALTTVEEDLGRPYAFVEQYDGQLVQDIRPIPGCEGEASSRGRTSLPLHTDDAFLDGRARPESIAIVGIENTHAVPTVVVRLDDVIGALAPDVIDALMSPSFVHIAPPSFRLRLGVGMDAVPRPVLHRRADGLLEAALSASGATSIKAHFDGHLAKFRRAACQAARVEVRPAAGEVHVLSNTRLLHGRDLVPAARWLKRVYLRRDLTVLNAVASTGRPFLFAAELMVAHSRADPSPW